MVEWYGKVARRLYPLRTAAWMLAGVAVAAFLATIVLSRGPKDEAYMLLAIVALMWSLCVVAVIYGFVDPLPPGHPDDGFFARMTHRLRRLGRFAMALVMTGLCGAVVIATARAAGLAVRAFGG